MNVKICSVLFILVELNCVQGDIQWIDIERICPNQDIRFAFFNREQKNITISATDTSRLKATIKPTQDTYVIIHGFLSSIGNSLAPGIIITPALLNRSDYNVILVDWSHIAGIPWYLTAVDYVPLVANCTAQMLDSLVKIANISIKSFTCIGHSLGAHACGSIHQFTTTPVYHIIALDVASPLYTPFTKYRLTTASAEYVQSIHTNAGRAGQVLPTGDIDFYFNDGTHQKACISILGNIFAYYLCNHLLSAVYYAESVNSPKGFYGCPLGSDYSQCLMTDHEAVLAGFPTPLTARGLYYVETGIKPPFALGNTTKRSSILHLPN